MAADGTGDDMREKVSAGEPLIHIEVLEKTGRGGQVKVRRLSEPNAGLEEYVKTRQLLAPWSERRALLEDERREKGFASGQRAHQALAGAIGTVMAATGYSDGCADDDGTVHMRAVELRQLARLSGLPEELETLHPEVYVDRFGMMHLPVEAAEQLAHAYAAAEPEIVLMYIEDEESELKAKGYQAGDRFYHDYLRDKTPGFALARYWAGHEEEVAQLRAEIERLRGVVRALAAELEKSGHEREGWRMRRALDGG
jgi:hypothetical protein